jgi:hypothetical protein
MERAVALRAAREGKLPPAMMSHHPLESALALRLLSQDPSQRPTAMQLLQVRYADQCDVQLV